MVPTVDTLRYNFLVKALVLGRYPVLLTGPVGTGKTSVAQSVLQGLDMKWTPLTVNMSSQVGSFVWPLCKPVCCSCSSVLAKKDLPLKKKKIIPMKDVFS